VPYSELSPHFQVGAQNGQRTTIREIKPEFNLANNGILSGWIGANFDFIQFSAEGIARLSGDLRTGYSARSGNPIAFLSVDNQPELLNLSPRDTADSSANRLVRSALPMSPLKTSEYVSIHQFGQDIKSGVFLVEASGEVTVFRDNQWQQVPFIHNVKEFGRISITPDGAAIPWDEGRIDLDKFAAEAHPYNLR
jgi:hypothetical protein